MPATEFDNWNRYLNWKQEQEKAAQKKAEKASKTKGKNVKTEYF